MIKNRKEYKIYLQADLAAHCLTTWKWYHRFIHHVVYFQRLLREIEYYENTKKSIFWKTYLVYLKLRFHNLSIRLGLTIPRNAFGAGLSIAHYGSIVISGKARIGIGCRIHSDVNIGELNGKAPVIGDRVFIGPGAKIYGDIKIGNNVAIGANSVVNKDIPDNVTVAGVPSKIISNKGADELSNQKSADLAEGLFDEIKEG